MTPHPDLADLALRPTTDPIARVQQASRLVGGNPEHQESHFLLARLSLAAGLSGEARRHADAAARAGLNERRLWMLRAELEGDAPAGREALRLAATAAPDAAWRCDACGAEQAAWAPVCPACHVPGRLRWGQPLRPALTAE
ncbi:MAG: heme biosynthesis protein HemY, partial [Rhodospirillales bacterium]|nr:heme biosynthesis protein HemY [Rhodospirillales bacterium]